ncbi:MAG: hypothetical protein ABIR18_07080 [Chitinophagaceae bacterium]
MKNLCFTIICCSFSISAFTQAPKPKAPVIVKKTPAATAAKSQQTASKTKAIEKVTPPAPLTQAELRRINTDDLLSFMISCGDMFNEEHNIYSDRKNYTEYTDLTDSSVTILLKNILGHTINRIFVTYDSAKVKRMVQYKLKKKSYSAQENNAVWITELDYSYFFIYDSTNPGRVLTIGKAGAGLENKDYAVVKYFLTYRNDGVDSVECIDHTQLKYNCVYYNGKKKPENIFHYSYELAGTKPFRVLEYISNYNYEGTIAMEKQKVLQKKMDYIGFITNRMTSSGKGNVNQDFKMTRNANYSTPDVILTTYSYDSIGHLLAGNEYKSSTSDLTSYSAINYLVSTIKPRQSSYKYNEQGQVIQRTISFHDSCEDSEEVIDYTIGKYGFVTETKSKRDFKFKCRL